VDSQAVCIHGSTPKQSFKVANVALTPSQPAQKHEPMRKPCPLFFSSSSLISLLSRPLLTLALVSRLASRVSQLSVSTTLNSLGHLALLDLLDLGVGVDDWQTSLNAADQVLSTRNLLLGCIALLVLAELAGEEDEAGLVGL
jgi:hypothetical protein